MTGKQKAAAVALIVFAKKAALVAALGFVAVVLSKVTGTHISITTSDAPDAAIGLADELTATLAADQTSATLPAAVTP